MHKANWDDLRFVLAVAQSGSVSAAARSLGVNHATVLRRVAAFEDRHGGRLFERTAQGYTLAPEHASVIEAARSVEEAVLAVERLIEGTQAPLAGVVRVTSTDTFCLHVLPPVLAGLRRSAADLRVDLICSNAHLDLARLDAEVTVRPSAALPEDLDGTAPAELGFAVYAAKGGAGAWLGLGGALARSRPGVWLAGEIDGGGGLAGSADSFVALREMAAARVGRAILPCCLGDPDPRLSRVRTAMPPITVPIWVASHADLADVPRIAAVRRHLSEGLAAQADALRGA